MNRKELLDYILKERYELTFFIFLFRNSGSQNLFKINLMLIYSILPKIIMFSIFFLPRYSIVVVPIVPSLFSVFWVLVIGVLFWACHGFKAKLFSPVSLLALCFSLDLSQSGISSEVDQLTTTHEQIFCSILYFLPS